MDFVVLKCPNCHGELDVRNSLETFYCTYCGCKLMVDGLSDSMVNAKLRLYEIEHEERSQASRQEYAERAQRSKQEYEEKALKTKQRHDFKMALINHIGDELSGLVILAALFVFIAVAIAMPSISHAWNVHLLKQVEAQVEREIADGNYDEALFKANQLRLDDNYSSSERESWDERRNQYIAQLQQLIRERDSKNPNMILAPLSSVECCAMVGQDVKAVFEDAGFSNIEMRKVPGSAGWFKKSNLVKQVTLDGVGHFTVEDYYDIDASVVIYYYEK